MSRINDSRVSYKQFVFNGNKYSLAFVRIDKDYPEVFIQAAPFARMLEFRNIQQLVSHTDQVFPLNTIADIRSSKLFFSEYGLYDLTDSNCQPLSAEFEIFVRELLVPFLYTIKETCAI